MKNVFFREQTLVKITDKFMYLNVVVVAVSITIATLFFIAQMRMEATRQATLMQETHIKTFWELLREKGTDFKIVDGKLLAGRYVLNGNYELPDKVREIFGGTATIFMGDVRVSTNVLTEDGKRAVGTRLKGPAFDALFRKGKPYRGEALILGIPYFTAYDPIRNAKGEVIGVLYAGVKKSEFFATYDRLRVNQLIMAGILAGIFAFITFLLLSERRKNEMALVEREELLQSILHGSPIPQFVIDRDHRVLYWNNALEACTGLTSGEMIGTRDHWKAFYPERHPCLGDLLIDGNTDDIAKWYEGKFSRSKLLDGAYEAIDFFPELGEEGRWLYFTATLVRNSQGDVMGAVETLEDISERRAAEEALRQSEEKFRSMTAAAMNAIVMIDAEGKICFWNKAAEKIFGWSCDEALERDLHELLAPEAYQVLYRAAFPEFRSSGRGAVIGKQLQLVAIRKGGEEFPIDLALSAVRLRDSWNALGIISDISDRKRAEDELQEQLHFLQELIDAIPNPIFFKNISGSYLGCNRAFQVFLGLEKHQIVGKTVYDLGPRELADIYFAKDAELLGSRTAVQIYESTVENASGFRQDVIFNKAVFTRKDGTVGGIVGIVLDITERKRMEDALRESEERFRRTFDQSPVGAAIVSLDYRFLRVNDEWCRITGYSEQQLLALRMSDISHPEDLESDIKMKARLVSGEIDTFQMDKRYLRKDGRLIWVRLSVCLMKNSSDEPLYYLPMMEDITERKKLEEEVLKNQKLESLGVLAGGIAHDFNNLLTGILGNISLAKMAIPGGSRAYKRLDEAEAASERARDLTYQLLTFSKGGAPIKKVDSIDRIVRDSAEFAVRGSNVRCEYSITEEIRPVEVDEGQVSQVIHNLIINAVQAMPDGGLIRISIENASDFPQNLLPDRGYVEVTIQDSGVGIPQENLSRIFDPYFTTKPKGSGLGLATVFSIIRNHEGHIEVDSRAGEGTVFHFYLPVSDKGFPIAEPVRDSSFEGRGRILLMDDEEIVREVGSEILAALGYAVTACCDGVSMLTLFREARQAGHGFHAVILDLTIPGGMGGREAMGMLIEIDPEAKGIVSSGYNNDPILSSYREYGFKGVVTKPYTVRELGEVLQSVLQS
jgi:PAS domain S-box-containing protein